MNRIFKKEDEEHNFWQNYTDLMSGFLIVFIIASLVAYGSYKVYEKYLKDNGITKDNVEEVKINAELYRKIKDFQEAQKEIKRDYFDYNEKFDRFECKIDVQFQPDEVELPKNQRDSLLKAGEELKTIINSFRSTTNVAFKIIIEGRAAKPHGSSKPLSKANYDYAAKLSYERARELYLFWKAEGVFNTGMTSSDNEEIFISGSGYEGKGRYRGFGKNGEDRNKTFIIQIIPYIVYK